MLVSVCMIVRNEAAILAKAIESTKGLADEVVILDTGSTDGTVALARELGAVVLTGGDRMHKAESRNSAAAASSGEWTVILDADEQIADPVGLREHLQQTDAQALFIKLAYMDANDNPTLSYAQMRIWRRGTYQYKYRAHEVPLPTNGWGKREYTDFVWEHRPPPDRVWKSDYTLNRLLLDVEENPEDARPLYYLGRQYMYRQEWTLALETLEAYLAFSGIDEADAWHCVARCYKGLGDEKQQIKALFTACAAQPGRREWWGELAEIYHSRGQDSIAVGLLKCSLEQPMPTRSYIRHFWYGAHVHDLLARCLWKLKRYEEGYNHARQAVELEPNDKRLKDNLSWFERKIGIVPLTRIFITGCAKSGTTLLKRLFYAFENVEIMPGEQHITRFCQVNSDAQFLIGKRHRCSLFSEHLAPVQTESQIGLIKQHGIKVVNIVRDGRDVISSDYGNVSPRRWVSAMRQRREYGDLITVEINYENMVKDPDAVQEKVAKALGLTIRHRWSEYPAFVPESQFVGSIYSKRPLDTASIGRDADYRAMIDDIAHGFDEELSAAGYVAPSSEAMDKFYLKNGPDIHASWPRHNAIAELIEGPVVLDVGCGTGDLLKRLQGDGLQLHGTDISQIALDMARQRGIDATFYRQPDLPSIMCNTIVMSQVLEHLDDDEIFVQQAKERLVSDGLLIVSVPRNGSLPSPDHKRDYTEDSLRELLSNVGKPVLHSWPGEEHRILMTVRNE